MPFATVNGISVYYETHGEGEPLVLIGGLGSQTQSWASQVPEYSRHFRVIVFDNRGAGRTDKPAGPYTIEQMAHDTVALMDTLGIEAAHIAGKSMGGMIGQRIAIHHPARVRKLVLGCTCATRDEVGNEILRMGRETATSQGMKALWLGALFWGYSRGYIEANIEAIRGAMSMVRESEDAIEGYMGQSLACEGHDTTGLASTIDALTLVMYGKSDLIVSPGSSKRLAELIAGSVLMEFDAGHGFWRENQEEVDRAVLEFLLG